MTAPLPAGFFVLPAPQDSSLAATKKKLGLLVLQTLLSGARTGPRGRLADFLEKTARGPDRTTLRTALERVDVLGPVLALRTGLVEPMAALEVAVPALALAIERANETLLWDAPVARAFDPARRRVFSFDPPAHGLVLNPTGVEVRLGDGERFVVSEARVETSGLKIDEVFHPIDGASGPVLALADSNPLAHLEEHPEKFGNALDLGGHSIDDWKRALAEAFELVAVALPDLHAEILATLERIVPVGYDAEKHLSASYREVPGLIYLTLHPSALTLAEAIIHETQHGKLNVLRWFDPLFENADSAWTSSPVRPDLRPLSGVLLAVHAFIPVAALHRRLLEIDHPISRGLAFARRRDEVLASNAEGLRTLREMAKPTPLGRKVMDALEELESAVNGVKLPAQPGR